MLWICKVFCGLLSKDKMAEMHKYTEKKKIIYLCIAMP